MPPAVLLTRVLSEQEVDTSDHQVTATQVGTTALEETERTLAAGDRRPSNSMAALHDAVFLDPPCLSTILPD